MDQQQQGACLVAALAVYTYPNTCQYLRCALYVDVVHGVGCR